MLVHAIPSYATNEFVTDVRAGLTRSGQKELPSKYLYDNVGSALFEVISHLPEYGLTRADERLLRRHADEIVDRVAGPVAVAELGSGSGKKTRWLLEAFCRRQHTSYYPVEISRSALVMCERELSDIDAISIVGFEREYLDGLLEVAAYRKSGQRLVVLFLGSTIGNFDRPAGVKFLSEVRRILEPGDSRCWEPIWKSPTRNCLQPMTMNLASRRLLISICWPGSIVNWTPTLTCVNSLIWRRSTTKHAVSRCTCNRGGGRL